MKYSFHVIDLWPYIIMSMFFIWSANKNIRITNYVSVALLFVFSALRYDVGWDYMEYTNEIKNSTVTEIFNSRYELLNQAIFAVCIILDSSVLFFLIYSALTNGLIWWVIEKQSDSKNFSWLIYYTVPIFFMAAQSTVRHSLAQAIVFLAYVFVYRKQYLQFSLCVLFAVLIHKASIVMLVMLLCRWNIGNVWVLMLYLISFLVGNPIETFLRNWSIESSDGIERYRQFYLDVESKRGQLLVYLINVLFWCLFIAKIRIGKLVEKTMYKYNMVILGVLIFNALDFDPVASVRLASFMLIFSILLVPDFISLCSSALRDQLVSAIAVCLNGLLYLFMWKYISAYENGVLEKASVVPYRTWLNN